MMCGSWILTFLPSAPVWGCWEWDHVADFKSECYKTCILISGVTAVIARFALPITQYIPHNTWTNFYKFHAVNNFEIQSRINILNAKSERKSGNYLRRVTWYWDIPATWYIHVLPASRRYASMLFSIAARMQSGFDYCYSAYCCHHAICCHLPPSSECPTNTGCSPIPEPLKHQRQSFRDQQGDEATY